MDLIVRLFEDDGTVANQEKMAEGIAEYRVRPSVTEQEIIENAKDASFIIVGYEQITEKVLDSLPNLKMVCFQSIGVNGVDMDAANKRNIPVSNIGTYCVPEVADYTLAAILADNRKLVQLNETVKQEKRWQYDAFPSMRRLSEQTVGFVGFGSIPRAIRERLVPFGAKVIAYDPFIDAETMAESDVEKVSIEEVFTNSDFISLHIPLTPETANSIDESLFNLATKKPTFINSARGGVVNEQDLVAALDSGNINFAYLDVLQSEFPDLDNDVLVQHDKTLITPHTAFYSLDSMEQSGIDSLQNIIDFIQKNYDDVQIVNRRSITIDGGNE